MAVIAELHNGTQIHFPDGTPDHEVDGAVQRHLGMSPPDNPDLMTSLLAAVGQHAGNLQNQKNQEISAANSSSDKRAQLLHKTHVVVGAAHVDAVNQMADKFSQAIMALGQPLQQIADNTGMVRDLIMAINNLSGTILDVGKAAIAAAHAPKELYNDENGVPKGVVTKHQLKL